MSDVLDQIWRAFGSVSRPDHFTDYMHCEECTEHDETLRSHSPDTIGVNELGNPGWDPICFATPEGFNYYMPGLARLALGRGEQWYLGQFLCHLDARRIAGFSSEQRAAVLALLEHIRETMSDEVESSLDGEELKAAIYRLRAG